MPLQYIDIPIERIADFCRRCGARRLATIRSTLHGNPRPEKDSDALARFAPCRRAELAILAREIELSALMRRTENLYESEFIRRCFRDSTLSHAPVMHVAV